MLKLSYPEPATAPCDACGEITGVTNLVERTSIPARTSPKAPQLPAKISHVCLSCWHNPDGRREVEAPRPRGRRAEVVEPSAPRDPRAAAGATRWATIGEAEARADVVTFYLGSRPLVTPSDLGAQGPYHVVGDSPLVPGFEAKKAANPLT